MNPRSESQPNIQQIVPLLAVSDMEASLRYYVDGLGFEVAQKWLDEGQLRWCRLQRDGVALMLQQFATEGHHAWVPDGKVGEGVSIYFICRDALALYRQIIARGVEADAPFVGNGTWVVGTADPDGYRLFFESVTDAQEGTVYRDGMA